MPPATLCHPPGGQETLPTWTPFLSPGQLLIRRRARAPFGSRGQHWLCGICSQLWCPPSPYSFHVSIQWRWLNKHDLRLFNFPASAWPERSRGCGLSRSQGLGLVRGIDPLPADTVQTSIRPHVIRIPVLGMHSATHSASLANRGPRHGPGDTHASSGLHVGPSKGEGVEPALLPFGCSPPGTTLPYPSAGAEKQL